MRTAGGRPRRANRFLALALCCAAAGCASAYDALPCDRDLPEFAALLDARDALPARVTATVPEAAGAAQVTIAVEERGRGTSKRLVVLVHGVLSDRRTWRFVAGDLGRDHDLLLVDLPGCGESGHPAPDARGPEDYAPTALARCVLAALRGPLAARSPDTRVVLVGHSLGGAVVLRMLGDPGLRREFADVRQRVDTAVLFSPVDFAMDTAHPVFREIVDTSATEMEIGLLTGIVRDEIATVFAARAPCPLPLRPEVDRVLESLEPGPRLTATQALLREALPLHEDWTPDRDRAAALVADYRNVDVPCLLVWGARDGTLPLQSARDLLAGLPQARLCVVPRTTHAIPTERPRVCAELIRRFAVMHGRVGASLLATAVSGVDRGVR